MKMTEYVMQDAYRIYDKNGFCITIARYWSNISYRVRFQMRLIQYLRSVGRGKLASIINVFYNRRNSRLGIYLPASLKVGAGLFFPHNFPVVINDAATIGENCIIHSNAQIGSNRGKSGAPVIGNNCFLGNGCHIIGNPHIGDWCFISPGAFVTKDVPSGSVVGFGLNNIISNKGEETVRLYLPKKTK